MSLLPQILVPLLVIAAATVLPAAEGKGGALGFTLNSIDGKPYPLAQHLGEVVMLVNVASRCGNTPQYSGLEAIYDKYKAKGFVVIGVPANNFGGQEPGSNEDIKAFCTTTYQVAFPMMAKVSVKGADIDPLYAWLTTKSPKPGEVGWNFAKFLIDRKGTVVERFDPKTKPQDPTVIAAIEKALAAK
ncbi:MAG: glutathione peroxidase [Planctomycetes bacterium]|nr:glutathione peroxidase [Planctomycetota bacterium]